jgi:hypothetical protein
MKRSHWILMLLCCLIPLAGIAAIYLFRIPTSSVLFVRLMLLCPVLHLFMMRGMGHDHRAAGDHSADPACHAPAEVAARPGPEAATLARPPGSA